ncbi:Protein MSP1 [Termitomyces sp. J132]|nr:Protein MSP1 [Termitomyces sp. J132]
MFSTNMTSTTPILLLFVALFFAFLTVTANAATFLVLSTTLSLIPLPINAAPMPLAIIIPFEMSSDSTPSSSVATVEITTLVVTELVPPSIFTPPHSVSTEQTNATDAGTQRIRSMEEDDNSTTHNDTIMPRLIITIVACVVLFFALFLAIHVWRHCYPPRPGPRQAADQLGVATIPMVEPGPRLPQCLHTRVALFVSSQVALYYTVRWVLDGLNPEKKQNVNAKQLEALKRLGHSSLKLDEYERTVANEVIHPDDINIRFSDIGGLDPIISSLRESIIYPLLYPNLFSTSSLLGAPKGVLLFGPPGCGKTMLAKALAKESGATFINIAASVLTNKWYGESNKLVAGLFSLARKTQPSIIFIDEIDSFLRERTKGDHEVTGMMKAEFMTLWDGLLSASDRILVLGATNRPNDIDSAILRRMPKRFAIQLPDYDQRLKILTLMLKDTKMSPNLFMGALAAQSEGFSGSDLKELCRNAAMVPVREYLRNASQHPELFERGQAEGFDLRPLALEDFFAADGTSPLPPPEPDYDETRLE